MGKILKYQQWHVVALIVLLALMYIYAKSDVPFLSGSLWGISTLNWYLLALSIPILHQFYVLIIWRAELHFNSFSKLLGAHGFKLYKIGFAIFMLARIITIVLLAYSSSMTMQMNPTFSYVLSGLLFIPASYLFYSVAKYFGIDRAVGIDHFYSEQAKKEPFVNQGIFKYTANGMYKFGVLALWIPGILLQSKAAISLAFFSHLYIWVHYYFTELPDIKIIYGENKD